MADYPTYPIYVGSVTYHRELMSYDIASKWDNSEKMAGLPRYRIRDYTSFFEWMYIEDPGEEAVRERTIAAWKGKVENPEKSRSPDFEPVDPQDVTFTVKRLEPEEWHMTWFCHETVDTGQTNEEALASFQRFLDRKRVRMNYGHDPYYEHQRPEDSYCAMGAEDRWRWRGEGDDDEPPCRCDGCKKSGMIRINH